MDSIDKFLKLYSYKFSKGYPDINNEQDILLLENILDNIIIAEFEDSGDIPTEIEDIRIKINSHPDYEDKIEAIQNKKSQGIWFYIKDVSKTSRGQRKAVLQDLVDKKLLPGGEIKGGDQEAAFLDTGKYKIVVKGAGSKYSTSVIEKEGLVVAFYNALNQGWNPEASAFNSSNMSSLLESFNETSWESGLGKASNNIKNFIGKFDSSSSDSKAAQTSLNDPLSSALRIYEDYPGKKLIRDGIFDTIRDKATQLTGIPADKWNPGDVYLQISNVNLPPSDSGDVTPWVELNKLFVNDWGSTDAPLVSISLKQEKAQGGKAKSFLQKFKPEQVEGMPPAEYQLNSEELKYNEDQYDEAINSYKVKINNEVNKGEFLYAPGDNPPKLEQKKFKLAAYKALDYLFSYFKDNLDSSPTNALVKMAAYGMSITGVNPTFFKLIGKSNGSVAEIPAKYPAGATAQLTPGTVIEIKDGSKNGSLIVSLEVDILNGPEVEKSYQLELVARSNGGKQNTIEIQRAVKK